MNKKQFYVTPQLRVVELGTVNHLLGASKEVETSNKVTGDNAVMNNTMQQPWTHTWE